MENIESIKKAQKYGCNLVIEGGIICDVQIEEVKQSFSYIFTGDLNECERYRAQYLNDLDEKALKLRF